MSDDLPLEEQVIAALRRITRAIDLHSRLLLQKNGLTIPQLSALQAMQRLQPVTVGALARDIHLGAATVTGILGRLENRGLITRSRGDLDRRSVVVRLTENGAKMVAEAPSLLQDRFHRELAKLQEWEQTMILATLQRIASLMDAEDIEAAPVLVPGVASAPPEDVSRYLEKAVVPTDETPLAEEEAGTIREDLEKEPVSENNHNSLRTLDQAGLQDRDQCCVGGPARGPNDGLQRRDRATGLQVDQGSKGSRQERQGCQSNPESES